MDVCVPLPEDGESLAHELRSIRTNLPILAVSASPEEAIAARIGAYEFLPKPFELGDLLDAMERGVQEGRSRAS
jgi:FixJ family two-component response regulator